MPTVVIQPSNKDTSAWEPSPTSNNGTTTTIDVGYSAGSPGRYYGFVAFDLSSIPTNAVVSSAVLGMTVENFGPDAAETTFLAQRVTGSWTETGLTWNVQPSATTTDQGSASGIEVLNNLWNVTITNIAQGWINGSFANHGVRLLSNTNTNNRYMVFYSREYTTNTTRRPKLTVTYNIPPNAPTSLAPAGTSYDLSQTVVFSWTHNDPDGDAQSAYEIRWRRSGSADAYSTLTANTSTQSRNEPASTFNVGTWEYNVRTKDTGTSTFGAWSSTQTFTVTGIERWGVVHI